MKKFNSFNSAPAFSNGFNGYGFNRPPMGTPAYPPVPAVRRQANVDTSALAINTATRVPVVLVLDISSSMSGQPIDELNRGVAEYYQTLAQDEKAHYAAETCVVTFASDVNCVREFTTADECPAAPAAFRASGMTCMGEAVNLALDKLEARIAEYRSHGVPYHRPWLVLMTDGMPNGSASELERAVSRVREKLGANVLQTIPIAIGTGADNTCLARFSADGMPYRLDAMNFRSFFNWLSASVTEVSRQSAGVNQDIDRARCTWNEVN